LGRKTIPLGMGGYSYNLTIESHLFVQQLFDPDDTDQFGLGSLPNVEIRRPSISKRMPSTYPSSYVQYILRR